MILIYPNKNLIKLTNMKTFSSIVILCLVLSASAFSQETGEITDARDGIKYKTVKLKIELEGGIFLHRNWLAENLRFKSADSKCYKDEPAYCFKFGRLYSYQEALKSCPTGWHLSNSKEWSEVINTFGGHYEIGGALKEGGETKLEVIMAGFGDLNGVYSDVGKSAHFWDAGMDMEEAQTKKFAGLYSIHKAHNEISTVDIRTLNYNSVRCVEDYNY